MDVHLGNYSLPGSLCLPASRWLRHLWMPDMLENFKVVLAGKLLAYIHTHGLLIMCREICLK